MKKNHARLLCLLLAALMLLTLTACGGKEPADPNLIKIGDYTVLYKSAAIMVDDEGSDAIVLTLDYTNNSKENAPFWAVVFEKVMQGGVQLDTALVYPDPGSFVSITDDKFTDVAPGTTFEVHTSFVLRDATTPVEVHFSDLFDKKGGTITIDPTVLTRVGTQESAPAADAAASDDPGEAAETAAPVSTGDPLLDWWNGEWYGWWTVTGGDGDYESWSNGWWDCCAVMDIGSDYTGTVEIWDETEPRGNGVSYAEVSLNEAGTGEHGTLMSEGGWFLWADLAHADWIVDPGIVDYSDMICIDGWYEDDNGSFHYAMYLRPWGTRWDDLAADSPDNLPSNYENWYLPLIDAGKSMPDTIGELPQDGISEDEVDPQGEPEQPAETTAAADEDYGKSNADATGISTLQAMQDLYKICYESRSDGHHVFTYEEARDMLGSDGVVRKTASFTWNETKHTYRWETEDGSEYLSISFELEDGEEWYLSCSMSDKVINGLW